MGFLFAESNTKSASLTPFCLLAVMFYSLSNILCKHLFYIQARVEQLEPYFHLSYASSYYGVRA
jgi:hypothetical protein